jgi:FkbM family methyltransferase
MKTLLRRILRRLDVDLVRTHTTFEGHLARLLPALGVNVVLDVGAHHGEYARLLREIGYRGRIVSFEPVSASYASLRGAMSKDRDWRGFKFALGAERAMVPINITGATDLTSFLTPSSYGALWFGGSSKIDRVETVEVECLDNVIESCVEGIATPRIYLKLDTQGYDWQVLQGATAALERVVGMQTEIAVQPLYVGQPLLFPDNIRPFLERGFEATGMFAVSRDPRDMIAALEYDLVMRRCSDWA